MTQVKDLTGQCFGNLTVRSRAGSTKNGKALWNCVCSCGNKTIAVSTDLLSGHTRSCGCKKYESHNKRHGQTRTDIHQKWCQMRQRCYDPNCKPFKYYGAIGITVCPEWNNSFEDFRDWAYAHGYEEGLSLDRINNEMGYFPDNCRWVPKEKQSGNRRNNLMFSYNGKTQNLKAWCDELGLKYPVIYNRIRRDGYTFEQAITSKPYEYRCAKLRKKGK